MMRPGAVTDATRALRCRGWREDAHLADSRPEAPHPFDQNAPSHTEPQQPTARRDSHGYLLDLSSSRVSCQRRRRPA
eukprot:6447153-Prymnesium_polylepis.3